MKDFKEYIAEGINRTYLKKLNEKADMIMAKTKNLTKRLDQLKRLGMVYTFYEGNMIINQKELELWLDGKDNTLEFVKTTDKSIKMRDLP